MKLYHYDAGEGDMLVILHGLFGMSDNWMSIAKKLSTSFRVVVPDLRNHGRSPHSEVFNYQAMMEDVLEITDSLDCKKMHVLGHSMGGKVAMTMALNAPHRIDKLVVADIAPKQYKPSSGQRNVIAAIQSITPEDMKTRKGIQLRLSESIGPGKLSEAEVLFLLKNVEAQGDGYGWRFNFPVLSNHLDDIGCQIVGDIPFNGECLFVRGSRSNYILDSDMESIRHLFPAAQLHTILDADHWVHADKPIEFIEATEKFLKA